MVFSSRATYAYVPEFNKNKSLPAAEQLKIEIIRPKAEERGNLFSLDVEREVQAAEAQGSKPTKTAVTFKRRYNVSAILRNHVGKISGLQEQGSDGKTIAVVDGKALADSTMFGINGLIDELCGEVLSDVLTEDEKKSSE